MSTGALAWRQFRFERRLFWRNPSAAFFNFGLPLLFLVLIATVYSANSKELDVLVPGIAGMSIMATTFTALANNLVVLRENLILKRMQGSPIPATAYFGGVLGSAVLNAFVQVALVVAIGHLAYGVSWPQDWIELVVFTVLGVASFGALGIAYAFLIPNAESAPAYVNAVFLPMIFISGVFYRPASLPAALDALAQALPLTHAIDGLRAAIVTGATLADEWVHLAVLGGWGVLGLVAALRLFRWE